MRPVVRAGVTPLASIFGSGFLVVVPVLASAIGPYSAVGMVAVLLLAYGVGGVIRHNISVVEPVLQSDPPRSALWLERASAVALIGAYVLSICLYLHILAAFVLKPLGYDDAFYQSLIVTLVLSVVILLGILGGLKPLEALEKYALGITLLIVVVLLVAFGVYDVSAIAAGEASIVPVPERDPWEAVRVVAGTLIVVQGFETTRYMGDAYDSETRVRASRWSQLVATLVYLAFVVLAMPLVPSLEGNYGANSLFDLTLVASAVLAIPLVIAATLSQFSAAVADVIAAVGGIDELASGRFARQWSYCFVGAGALVLTWSGDTLTVIAWASRAFAFYYLLQCLVALTVCPFARRKVWISVVAVALLFVVIFAIPAG